MEQCAAFIAIDWSDAKHDICLLDASTSQNEHFVLTHTPEDLETWATALRTRFAGQKIAVCLEQSRGPLIYALLQDDFLVLSPINPATLAKYRQAFSPSRAKDDPQDADYMLEVLRHHRDRPKAWRPDTTKTRPRHYLVEPRRRLVHDRTRIRNRMTTRLQAYLPQVLQWCDAIRTLLVCAFLRRWPTLAAVQTGRPATRDQFLHARNTVRQEPLAKRIAAIKAAVPLTTDQAVLPSSARLINACATQMQTTILRPSGTWSTRLSSGVVCLRTIPWLLRSLVLAPSTRHAYRPLWARTATDGPRERHGSAAPGWHPCLNEVGSRPGCDGATSGRSFCDRHAMSTPASPSPMPSGRKLTIWRNALGATGTGPP